jgi:phosphodiesterase/alkaline phosphatase D-like protein
MELAFDELAKAIKLLEVGDWQGAHEIVQQDEKSALACWAHGIVHVMEGDLPNARYWYRAAARPFREPFGLAEEISALKSAAGIGRAKR